MRSVVVRYVLGLAGCVLMLYGVMWIPAINGPHLWFGIPSNMVWSSLWIVVSMILMARLERRLRTSDDEERQS